MPLIPSGNEPDFCESLYRRTLRELCDWWLDGEFCWHCVPMNGWFGCGSNLSWATKPWLLPWGLRRSFRLELSSPSSQYVSWLPLPCKRNKNKKVSRGVYICQVSTHSTKWFKLVASETCGWPGQITWSGLMPRANVLICMRFQLFHANFFFY